jgi:hypothetical protein
LLFGEEKSEGGKLKRTGRGAGGVVRSCVAAIRKVQLSKTTLKCSINDGSTEVFVFSERLFLSFSLALHPDLGQHLLFFGSLINPNPFQTLKC